MKRIIKYIITITFAIILFSCSDDFVNEKLNITGVGSSDLIFSPEWESDDYLFQCKGAGNADFIVESLPEWMEIEDKSGKFINEMATIRCKANIKPEFSKTGIYMEQMIISASGKKYAVPVYYISEGNPIIQVPPVIEVTYFSNGDGQLKITNTGDGILLWKLVSLPRWLKFETDYFDPSSIILSKGSTASLLFSFDLDNVVQTNLSGTIVLESNDKNHPQSEITVKATFGAPKLNIYNLSSPIVFNTSTSSQPLTISNIGDGILLWRVEELPNWLSVSKSRGTLIPYSNQEIILTCDYSKLQPGLNTATISIKSNDIAFSSYPVTIKARMPGNSESLRSVEGNIIDVTFNKRTNTLYYVTSQPNKLVAYNVNTKNIENEFALTKTPNCLSISADFSKALIGHGGLITAIDLNNFSLAATFDFDYTIFDIEWAQDDWFCYTIAKNTVSNLFWLNIKTNEVYETKSTNYRVGSARLKKVPNESYIIASSSEVSPSGIYVFDIETKTLKSYTHSSMDNIWFFNGGSLLIDSYSRIIKTSTITSAVSNSINSPTPVGELKTDQYPIPAWHIDFSQTIHSIWAIFSYYPFNYYPPVPATIYQFDDNDYSLKNTYYYDNFYQPDAKTPAYEVEARYVFANSEATELSVLRKGKDKNNWTIEFIPIQ
ncbi:hypothetical protein MASR2M47_30780 [Draconibacterium sp.]|jgi:hypothetical protein